MEEHQNLSGQGRVYWITGLAGSGKTTVGRLLYAQRKAAKEATVLLDGDLLRKVFGDDLGYTRDDRHACAMRYARICRMLAEQGIDVICCTISMFEDVRQWNRTHIADYKEIYLKTPLALLRQRNQKGLYENAPEDVVGLGIDMEEPQHPDCVLENDGQRTPQEFVREIEEKLK